MVESIEAYGFSKKKKIDLSFDVNLQEESFANISLESIIATTINRLFNIYDLQSKGAIKKLIWANETLHLKVLWKRNVVVDTRQDKFKDFWKLLKVSKNAKRKLHYLYLILYLSFEENTLLEVKDWNEQDINALNSLLHFLGQSNEEKNIEEYLTNEQLAFICSRLSVSPQNLLVEKYSDSNLWNDEENIQAINLLKTQRQKYGSHFLDRCLNLIRTELRLKGCRRMFTLFDRNRNRNRDRKKSITLSLNSSIIQLVRQASLISIYNYKGILIAEVTESGLITFKNESQECIWILSKLLAFASDPIRQIMYYGDHSGNCSFCNLPLSDPISLNVGYGKVCADHYNLVWG